MSKMKPLPPVHNAPEIHKVKVVLELPVGTILNLALEDHEHIAGAPYIEQRLKIKRLKQFAVHGCKCWKCGREGNRILVTVQNDKQHHVDLYHVEGTQAVMMNRDHIVPASKGGDNSVWNMRPACSKCNGARGNEFTDEDKKQSKFNQRWAQWNNRLFLQTNWFKRFIARKLSTKTKLKIAKMVASLF